MKISIFEAIGALGEIAHEIQSSDGMDNYEIVRDYLLQQKERITNIKS